MLLKQVQILVILCSSLILANSLLKYQKYKDISQNGDKLKILFMANGSPGNFEPHKKLALKFKANGHDAHFIVNYDKHTLDSDFDDQKQNGIQYEYLNMQDILNEDQWLMFRQLLAEWDLLFQGKERNTDNVNQYVDANLQTFDSVQKVLDKFDQYDPSMNLSNQFIYYQGLNEANYLENYLKGKNFDLVVADLVNGMAAEACYRTKTNYISFFPQLYPVGATGSFWDNNDQNSSDEIQCLDIPAEQLASTIYGQIGNFNVKYLTEFYKNAENSVYGSIGNFYGSLMQAPFVPTKNYRVCPTEYFKTILMSNKLYWKKALDIGPYSYMSEELMNFTKNDIFIGDRQIPYNRDPSTDPEAFSDDKNPFTEQHPPRIYISLGTRANNKPEIFEGIMTVLGQQNYPTTVASGGNDELFNTLTDFKAKNDWPNMIVLNFAPQQEILAKTDIYFCHGGASSVIEGIYLKVPQIMVPQATDQTGNATIIKQFGIGIILDQTEVGKDDNKFQTAVKNSLDTLMSDWKSYRKEVINFSNDMKNSDSYDSAVEKIEKLAYNNELIPKPLIHKKSHIWKYVGYTALAFLLIYILHKIFK